MCLYFEVSQSTPRPLMDSEKWQPQLGHFVLPLAISAQSRYWFCLKLHMILQTEKVLFQQHNQAWLAISVALKSVFQAQSTRVSSPALQPLHQMHISSVGVQSSTVPLSVATMEMSLEGLSSLAWCQAVTLSETSFKSHEALVWFGQTYDMKPEHDDWEACSLQSSTNKIIFSQIDWCLFLFVLGDQSTLILYNWEGWVVCVGDISSGLEKG